MRKEHKLKTSDTTLFHRNTFAFFALVYLVLVFVSPAWAELEIRVITPDLIGLDSNKPVIEGPDTYHVGVRVCNMDPDNEVCDVRVQFEWDDITHPNSDPDYQDYFTLLPVNDPNLDNDDTWSHANLAADIDGTGFWSDQDDNLPEYAYDTTPPDPATGPILADGINVLPDNCQDFYFNIEITRDSEVFDRPRWRDYIVTAEYNTSYGTPTCSYDEDIGYVPSAAVSNPIERRLIAMQLVSQARNSIDTITGEQNPEVGKIYAYEVSATQSAIDGYEQSYIDAIFPSEYFRIVAVETTLSSEDGDVYQSGNSPYVDACGWVWDRETFYDGDAAGYIYGSCLCTNASPCCYTDPTLDPADPTVSVRNPMEECTYDAGTDQWTLKSDSTVVVPGSISNYDYDDNLKGGGKDISVTYYVEILGIYDVDNDGMPDPIEAETVLYDNSGASWHYNTGPSLFITPYIPTYVSLKRFDVSYTDGAAVVQWTTDTEFNTLGFNILRKGTNDKRFHKINPQILSAVPVLNLGGDYSFTDKQAKLNLSYTYLLEEIELSGKVNRYGPFDFTIQPSLESVTAIQARVPTLTVSTGELFTRTPVAFLKVDKTDIVERTASPADTALRTTSLSTTTSVTTVTTSRVGNRAKLSVSTPGLYYLDAAEIAEYLGILADRVPRLIRRKLITMNNQGAPVVLFADSLNRGVYFYGVGVDSLYTDDNVYWLSVGSGAYSATPLELRPTVTTSLVTGVETLTRVARAEENNMVSIATRLNPDEDYWIWQFVNPADSNSNDYTLPIQVDSLASQGSTAEVTVYLYGMTDLPNITDHHARISLNSVVIGETTWDGATAHQASFTVAASLLHEGENQIGITGILDAGVAYSRFEIDALEIAYPGLYQVKNNRLHFDGQGNSEVTVYGFNTPGIALLNIDDPARPFTVTPLQIGESNGSYGLTMSPASPETPYFSSDISGVLRIAKGITDVPSNLQDPNNAVDYLVIAPWQFQQAASRLADYRSAQGLRTMVVTPEDIMDEFNQGIYSPLAIRDLLSFARDNWTAAPRFVTLAGKGTIDYKDYWGAGDNLVPTLIVGTDFGLVPTDNYFVDLVADKAAPEMAIGRIPVRTEVELDAYIDKLILHESTGGVAATQRILFLAGSRDTEAGDFPADSELLAALIPDNFVKDKMYLPAAVGVDAHQWVMDNINSATGFVNYIGHGSASSVGDLPSVTLMEKTDAQVLNNSTLPIMTFNTCLAGQYFVPTDQGMSLAEELVLDADGGAIAFWTASGMSLNSEAAYLTREFYKAALLNPAATTVGESIMAAKRAFAAQDEIHVWMQDVYNLMGDPAIPVNQ